ncbi:MAG: efflux RND transporter periplasmic adaptor subunit [Thermoanaerobaculia bacterium]
MIHKTYRRFLPTGILAAGLLVFAGGCSNDGPADTDHHPGEDAAAMEEQHDENIVELSPEKVSAAGIETTAAAFAALPSLLVTTGQVDFNQDRLAHVSPRLAGRVHETRARLGQQVRRGEVLAILDSIELGRSKAEYLRAKAREQLARENYEREQELSADRISSEQEMLAARAAHIEAQAELRSAEETLHLYGLTEAEVAEVTYDNPGQSLFPIRAPLSGKVVEKHATLGELVTPNDNLFLLADLSEVWILIDVYERDLAGVHLEDQVRVQVDAYPENVFDGEVSYLSDRVDPDTRTVRARINAANPGGKMRPGMFARIRISDPHGVAGEGKATRTRVVPESAVQRDGEEMVVFVPVGEHRFERREVSVGRNAGGLLEILDGLVAGEPVVTQGAFLLKAEAAKEDLGEGHGH